MCAVIFWKYVGKKKNQLQIIFQVWGLKKNYFF